jgi:heterodisulfide reductase subunit A
MNEALRLGVFICDCGSTLLTPADLPDIKAELEKLPDVAYVGISHNLCAREEQGAMLLDIVDKGINRVVVAACSPELHEYTFADILKKAGINPYLLSMANIREQCFWAHPKGKALRGAVAQIRMAINKARLLEPIEQGEISVSKDVLVVGGGTAGIESAIELSKLNLRVTLIERAMTLGGRLNQVPALRPLTVSPEQLLASRLEAITESENIEVLTSTELLDVGGEVGNFAVKMKREGEEINRTFGAIILATGYEAQFLGSAYGVELSNNIVTQSQLEHMLKSPTTEERAPRNVGFMLDISDEHSRASTLSALQSALLLKERFGSEVYILCKSLKVDSAGVEGFYREARNSGALFFKFDEPPQIFTEDGQIGIQVKDALLGGEEVVLSCDLLVVDERAVPQRDSERLRSSLNIGLGPRDFYQEDNIHLYPTACNKKGIFVVGNCHQDLDLMRATTEAANAAWGAYQLLWQGKITVDVGRVTVDPGKCTLCLTCIRYCPHGAILVDHQNRTANIIDIACDGCGICAAVCPAKAIKFKDYADEQISAELEGAYL